MVQAELERQFKILERAKEVKPTMEANGKELYTPKDAETIITAELELTKKGTGAPAFDEMKVSPDGMGYLSTNKKYVQAIPEKLYANRYIVSKVKENNKTITQYQVVTDYRAITEQGSGKVYSEAILVYLIGVAESVIKYDDGGEEKQVQLVYRGTKTISSSEFVNKFRGSLGEKSMAKVLKCIEKYADPMVTKDEISV